MNYFYVFVEGFVEGTAIGVGIGVVYFVSTLLLGCAG